MPDRRLAGLLVILVAAAAGAVLCLLIAWPFIPALTWAIVLAVVLMPLQRRLETWLGNRSVAALALVGLAALLLCLPLAIVARQIIGEAAQGAGYVEGVVRTWDQTNLAAAYPRVAALLAEVSGALDPAGAIRSLGERLTAWSGSILRGSIGQLVTLVLTFYFLFYMLRDRELARAAFNRLTPFDLEENAEILTRFADTVHATVVGTVLVAAVQGTLGGLIFWWLELPAPALWGVVMGVLALVPVLGAFVVWVPAAIYLALEGRWLDSALLAAWGGIIIAGIDNLLYPALVGTKLRLHTVVAFIGAVGGILWLGAAGLVLGPAMIGVTVLIIAFARKRFAREGVSAAPGLRHPLALRASAAPAQSHRPSSRKAKNTDD